MPIDARLQFGLEQLPGPMAQLHQAAALQGLQQENQIRGLQAQQAQKQMQAQQILDNAYKNHFKDGNLDMEGVYSELASSGQGSIIPTLKERDAKLQETLGNAQVMNAKLDELHEQLAGEMGAHMQSILEAGGPSAAENAAGYGALRVKQLQSKGLMTGDEAAGLVSKFDPSDEQTLRTTIKAMQEPLDRRTRQAVAAKMAEPVKVGAGEQLVVPGTGQVLAKGTPKPEPLEAKTMLVDGKAVPTNYDKSTGKYFDPVTKEDISARVEPFEKTATESGQKEQQQKLEQEYRGVLQSELRSRSGGLGLQDMKVNQANDLMGVLDQYRGKNMPAAVKGELALGVAKLLSPTGTVGIDMMNEFNQRTAQEGFSKAVAWLTADPDFANATSDAVRTMFEDIITRQGQISEDQREGYFKAIRGMAPTDLEPKRKASLESGMNLNPFVGRKKGASGASSGTTHMQAPDGRDMPAVPNSEVERLKALGAKVVQ